MLHPFVSLSLSLLLVVIIERAELLVCESKAPSSTAVCLSLSLSLCGYIRPHRCSHLAAARTHYLSILNRSPACQSDAMSKRSHSSMSNGGGILSSMLSSLSRTNESTLSAKQAEAQVAKLTAGRGQAISVDANSMAPDTAIAQFLQDMRVTIDEKGLGAEIEVELRFGKITSCLQDARCRPFQEGVDAAVVLSDDQMKGVGAKFVPGVIESEYPAFTKGLEYLLKGDGFSEHFEKQVVHNMPQSKRIIEAIDLKTNLRRAPQVQAKERLGSIDIFLPHCQWDCRVSISCEFPLRDLQGSLSEMPAAESIRHKDRTSAVGKDLRVDLTKVLEENTNKKSYEVEVELNQTVVHDWLKQPDENGQSWKSATVTASYLWKMVKYFMPQAGQAFKTNWGFSGATEVQNAYQLRLGVRGKFSGTMPVGFARWHIPLVKTREYFVSEKTDGVRYFLVVAGETTVLVDRSNAPFTTSGLDLLNMVLPEGTVLDGEFVVRVHASLLQHCSWFACQQHCAICVCVFLCR